MATPYVSGAAALTLYAKPDLNGYEVKQILLDSADTVASLDGYVQGQRRLNAQKAISKAQGYNPSFAMPEYSSTVFSSSPHQWLEVVDLFIKCIQTCIR